ncbi:MAG: non-canonical purine NTP diphosphatase [Cytophagaceae bacterium]
MEICFATNNPGKIHEVRAMLEGKYKVLSLKDIGCEDELPETRDTIEGNSKQKAEYVWEKYGVNCFSDDTGLEVSCLNGAPGVLSARYAGPQCNPEDNMDLLLKSMLSCDDRSAQFRTSITLIINGEVMQFEGIVEGTILKEKSGNEGFGYDPVFKPNGYEQTFAELDIKEKNQISHRGKAVRKLISYLMKK